MLKRNKIKDILRTGEIAAGCALTSRSTVLAEMMGYTGFDWVFIDTEHVPIESGIELENLIRAAEVSGMTPIVRVKQNSENYIRNALESGAMGVIIPRVNTGDDAARAVSYARFAPKGMRGADPAVRSAGYRTGSLSWSDYIRMSNEEIMVIPLLEDRACLENLDDILATDGVDAICFGATDYAMSLGLDLTNNFDHPQIKSAFETVVSAATQRGIPVLSAVSPCSAEQSRKLSEMGVKLQHFSSDLSLIAEAFNNVMENAVKPSRLLPGIDTASLISTGSV